MSRSLLMESPASTIAADRATGVWLRRYAKLVVGVTFCLLVAGGLVTSTGSGLSVPDWPTSFGYNMFTFPPSKWVGGIRFEHSHRLIASFVGMLTIGLFAWLLASEPRRWMKWLGGAALGSVLLQGLLGGLTVLHLLPPSISATHASLAQSFFCVTVAIATFTSRGWFAERARLDAPDRSGVRRLAIVTTAIVFVQLVIGAIMRHVDAGLAIPDFPLAFGRLVPPLGDPKVAIHFAHRVGALLVAVHVALLARRVWRDHRSDGFIARPAMLLVAATLAQLTLGALTVLSRKDVLITTAHVAIGALVLATSFTIALRAFASRRGDPSRVRAAMAAEPAPSLMSDLLALVKIRLTLLVLATTVVGYYLGATGPVAWGHVLVTFVGTGLLAGGAATLNQWMERDFDADMRRTEARPIPAGRVGARAALAFGLGISATGILMLAALVNVLTAAIGVATLALYLFAYTPLKRRTPWCTLVGAVPGALPPVMGWTAIRGELSIEAAILFAILFVWQMPHFLAIAMIHRDDYARAGFPMLTVDDPDGATTARHIAAYCIALVPLSLAPSLMGLSGSVYFVGALALGIAYLGLGIVVAVRRTPLAARGLFIASLVYLPILLGLMTADKL
ncbi:MAG: protoheme IX farnesyltransferase [Planctomycetes bacterium]|nr:protoheme IX farnesyltransferase [Planctomycetota bacterium]